MNTKLSKIGQRLVYVLLICIYFFGFTRVIVQAKQTGIKVSPLRARPVLDPGQSSTASLTVTNETSSMQKLEFSAEQFGVTNEKYNYSFKKSDSADWVKFVDNSLELQPGKSIRVPYSLAVPTNASPGGHYIALLVSTKKQQKSNTINEVYRVASLLYIQVNGDIKKQSTFTSFDVSWLTTKSSLPFTIRLASQGNTHFDARTLVESRSVPFNSSMHSTQTGGLLLPRTIKKQEGAIALGPLPGIYNVKATYSPPEGGEQIQHRKVLLIPWWFSSLIAASIIMLLILFGSRNRRKR